MVRVDKKMLEYLKDKELFFYQQALNEENSNEIKHWEKVASKRENANNRSHKISLGWCIQEKNSTIKEKCIKWRIKLM